MLQKGENYEMRKMEEPSSKWQIRIMIVNNACATQAIISILLNTPIKMKEPKLVSLIDKINIVKQFSRN